MCITEDKLVESYGKATPRERFRLIYKNYSIFPQLVDCYETGLFNRILFEVEYNRRKKNDDDLGVRIQTSHRSDPTAATVWNENKMHGLQKNTLIFCGALNIM